jgi:hypothetical protein
METIKTMDGKVWEMSDILNKMLDDSFYYGYLGSNALSSSSMKKLLESPKSYVKSLNMSSDSPALSLGRLVHLAVLEPHRLDDIKVTEGTKATKAYKDAVAQFGSANVFTQSEYTSASYISEAVWRNKEAASLLENCRTEVPAIKEINGYAVRGKADALGFNRIIDLKTTSDPVEKFHWTAKNYNYALQAALYMHLFDVDEFIFLVVNKDTKDLAIYECSGEFIQAGWDSVMRGIDVYKKYIAVDNSKEIINNYIYKSIL